MAHRTMVMVKKTYMHVGVITLFTAVLWLIITIYNSMTAITEVAVDANIKSPINATFDEAVFTEIIGRENLSSLSFEAPASSESAVTINEVVVVPETSEVPVEDATDVNTEVSTP
jgi:hypothetical protein